LTHDVCHVVGRDRVEAACVEAGAQVPLDSIAVASLRRRAKVGDRPVQPLLRGVAESQPPVAGHALSACALRQELVADRTSRGDPTVDRSPPLLAACVLESNLIDAGHAAVDVALDPLPTRGRLAVAHRRRLRCSSHCGAEMARPTAAAPPSVEIRPAEVKLAPRAILLRRDRPLSGKLPQGVPVHPEIFGSVSRVEPLVANLARPPDLFDDRRGQTICELREQALHHERLEGSGGVSRSVVTGRKWVNLFRAGGVR
jgi:hypothetical protein